MTQIIDKKSQEKALAKWESPEVDFYLFNKARQGRTLPNVQRSKKQTRTEPVYA